MTWDQFYNLFGIKDFIYFISSPDLQELLFPIKLVFLVFTAFFFIYVVYFMLNSSWMQYKFLEDLTEFFSWQAYGQRQLEKELKRIRKRLDSGSQADRKLAIIDADDFLLDVLSARGYEGKDFTETVQLADKIIGGMMNDILNAHEIRNSIVYSPDFKISVDETEKIIKTYETAVKNIGMV